MAYPLTCRTILLVSPQKWGDMRVSKHHYAIELARRGNRIFFLNPPDSRSPRAFSCEPSLEIPRLEIVTYRPSFPLALRFHARWLYDQLMGLQLRALRRRLGNVDLVWCFDPNTYRDIREFGADRAIYHVVDHISEPHSLRPAHGADLVISVAPEILEGLSGRRLLVQHGLSEDFARLARGRLEGPLEAPARSRPRVGYLGNLEIHSLDRGTLQALIDAHPEVEFHFWGDGTLHGANVTLHGARPPALVAGEIQGMDAFLVCYDARRDRGAGYNTHKMLEYLSTGKVVVSSRISAYEPHRDLIQMSRRDDNGDLPGLLDDALRRLSELNGAELQRRRLTLALQNGYAAHVDRIEAAL
jgi:glycosyltransferase involved in cell wall biosynthesis